VDAVENAEVGSGLLASWVIKHDQAYFQCLIARCPKSHSPFFGAVLIN
jgi:hypothetical protein